MPAAGAGTDDSRELGRGTRRLRPLRSGPPRDRVYRAGHPRHGRRGDRGAWRPARAASSGSSSSRTCSDPRAPERPSTALLDGDRAGFPEAHLDRRSPGADADPRVHIRQRGACAPKRHFHVRASAPLCGWLSYSCGTAAGVAARPPERRRRSGAFGRGRERPPLLGCLDRHQGGCACARPCHPPPGGRSLSISPWREGS